MSARIVYAVAALLVLTAGFACWCKAPLIWDGAYQFNWTLINQHPYSYLTRFHTAIFWWPTVWASHFTDKLMVLQTIYGLPFLLAPLVSLLVSWWLVRQQAPHLIIWPIFGLAAGSLPGQIFVINDSIFQLHLFWPIFMSLFVTLSKPKRLVLAILIAFQFVHQIGMILFFEAVAAALVLAWNRSDRGRANEPLRQAQGGPDRRGMLIRTAVMGVLLALSVAKIIITSHIPSLRDTYAEQQATWHEAMNMWGSGVRGWPIRGLLLMWTSAVLVLIHRRRLLTNAGTVQGETRFGIYALLFAAIGTALWVHWASDATIWWKALDYRRWVVPLSTPFFLLATLDALSEAPPGRQSAGVDREPLALLLGVTFALVLGFQSAIWHEETGRVFREAGYHAGVVVSQSEVPWTRGTPLDHWGSTDMMMALQGKVPRQILIIDPRMEENLYLKPPRIPHADIYPDPPNPGPTGWYDLRPLLKRLAAEPARSHGVAHRLDENTTPP